jgi:carbon monoxide dehydrogenase subunit G
MGISAKEEFVVRAPVEAVWGYLVDVRRVVRCLPGAELTEVVDERTFHGNVKVKAGAVTVAYKGKVEMTEVDPAARRVRMKAEGRESTGAGSARMSMESRLTAREGGETAVVVEAQVDVVGRLVQLGRGMIEQVAHQLFLQFATCVRDTLEAEAAAASASAAPAGVPHGGAASVSGASGGGGASAQALAVHQAEPVRILPVLFRAFGAWLTGLLRKLFGRKA